MMVVKENAEDNGMLFVICTSVLFTALVLYLREIYSRFSRYGVKHFRPWPILGNFGRVALKMDHISKHIEEIYNSFTQERFVGRFEFTRPIVMITDIELVKKITIKDFEHFVDHRLSIDKEADSCFGKSLFSLKGQDWKDMRATMSPGFTTSKIRHMLPFMVEVADNMVLGLKKKFEYSGVDYIDIDGMDFASLYTNDVIANCVFGLKVNSYAEENNQFYRMGKVISRFKFNEMFKFVLFSNFPKLMKKLKITMVPKSGVDYFEDIMTKTMQEREQKNIVRPDLIKLLMEAKKVWSDNDLFPVVISFYTAGFETVVALMAFTLYELAVNPHVQEKLVQEIRNNNIKNKGKFDYTFIQEMTYLDMVITEVLRLWPAVPIIDRLCVKDYNLGTPNDKTAEDYIIRKGEGIDIPIWAIHRDPKFYPDPLKFDPERFSEENKHNVKPYTYMPFGIGPRSCIGSRFALKEVKVMIYHFVQHIELSPSDKMCLPPRLCKNAPMATLKGGHWIRLKIRN